MPTILKDSEIPYRDITRKLFNESGEQKIIPFLGAGVPLSGRPFSLPEENRVELPDKEKIEKIISELKIKGKAQLFMQMAISIAHIMSYWENQAKPHQPQEDLLKRLKKENYPPSAGELAQLFSELANYSSFEYAVNKMGELMPKELIDFEKNDLIDLIRLVAGITGIGQPNEPLTAISSYYETKSGRDALWETLKEIFETKKEITQAHELLAHAAKSYLTQTGVFVDYLIITTNYDCLMEEALDRRGVPFAVLTMQRKDGKIYVRFSETVKDIERLQNLNEPTYPKHFSLTRSEPLVVLYKIHGCLYPKHRKTDDSVVISDSDYVNYISQMSKSEGGIPASVGKLLRNKPFLFFGYSLNDWNVRSIFETVLLKRGKETDVRDYSVMLALTEYEEIFFDRNNIIIIQNDLNTFAQEVTKLAA
ncbi:MAG: SIR2 family protein [Bacteroidetes bacterium]|nr:SIR2 family protein [Bacteroidota bacterium]